MHFRGRKVLITRRENGSRGNTRTATVSTYGQLPRASGSRYVKVDDATFGARSACGGRRTSAARQGRTPRGDRDVLARSQARGRQQFLPWTGGGFVVFAEEGG